MRNYIGVVDDIFDRLTANGFAKERVELEQTFRAHCFQSEILGETAEHLFSLERNNKDISTLIDDLVNELIAYCKYIGLDLKR
jgi:hypothetical protein